jgi:integrase
MRSKNISGAAMLGVSKNLIEQLDKLHRHNRQGSFKTKERYYEAMKRFCIFAALRFKLQKLSNISGKHIVAYVEDMQERGLAAGTIKTDLAAIRFWHDALPAVRYTLPLNEELDLERRTFGEVDRAWSHAEYNRMIALCWKLGREDYIAVFTLARYAGLRIHECFRIDTATAQRALDAGAITIKGKGGKIRTVPMHERIKTVLRDRLAATGRGRKLFVPDAAKTHLIIKQLQHFIIEHRKQAKDLDSERPLTFHGLRHLCAAEWFMTLKDVGYDEVLARRQVSLWLGHERDDVTRIYLASLPRLEIRPASNYGTASCL